MALSQNSITGYKTVIQIVKSPVQQGLNNGKQRQIDLTLQTQSNSIFNHVLVIIASTDETQVLHSQTFTVNEN